jgi:putative ABC transport system permease protein
VLIELFLPNFNNLADKEIAFSVFKEPAVLTGLVIIVLVVVLISGSYPAFLLSSFLPAKVIKGDIQSGASKGILRKVLVIIQFSLSIIVIISTMILQDQMDYIQSKDLGYKKENIMMMVPMGLQITPGGQNDVDSIPTFMREIRKNSGIISVTRSSHSTAGTGVWNTLGRVEKSSGEFEKKDVGYVLVDFDFIDLMQMEVLEGRSFDREMQTDKTDAVLVNETLVKEMGWNNSAIGKRIHLEIGRGTRDCKVIGVLKDFHFQSLHAKLMPQVILLDVDAANIFVPVISIKIRPENLKETIEFIKEKWLELNPTLAFEYTFLEDRVQDQYRNEERLCTIFNYFVFLCIFISCLGLFGLSSFIAQKRTKEIGIRKVHGASLWNIIYQLSCDFIKLVLISSIIAWPVAYYAMKRLLFDIYPYRATMDPWIFIITACIAVAIALITISYHVTKAALTDPVNALRYE